MDNENEKQLQVIALLRDNPAGLYGLDMVRLSDGLLKRVMIYLVLARMEADGVIESWKPEDGRGRRKYRLTERLT